MPDPTPRKLECPLRSSSDERDESPHFCLWLQAADRHIVIYVGFTSNFGSSDAEYPLLEALDIGGKRVRLHGIDAPESEQNCQTETQTYRYRTLYGHKKDAGPGVLGRRLSVGQGRWFKPPRATWATMVNGL